MSNNYWVVAAVALKDYQKQIFDFFGFSIKDKFELWLAWGVVQRKVSPKMKQLWRDFIDDRTFAVRLLRSLMAWFAVELGRGSVPYLSGPTAWKIAPLVLGFSIFFGAGQRNPLPGDIKRIAQDPGITPTPKDKMQPPGI